MTSHDTKTTEDIAIANKNWDKLQDNATKAGYRDGISDGRDSNFQNSFDNGYREGFKSGFSLGLIKGQLSAKQISYTENSLQKSSRGNCCLCKDKSLEENKSVEEIVELQNKMNEDDLIILRNKYCVK